MRLSAPSFLQSSLTRARLPANRMTQDLEGTSLDASKYSLKLLLLLSCLPTKFHSGMQGVSRLPGKSAARYAATFLGPATVNPSQNRGATQRRKNILHRVTRENLRKQQPHVLGKEPECRRGKQPE